MAFTKSDLFLTTCLILVLLPRDSLLSKELDELVKVHKECLGSEHMTVEEYHDAFLKHPEKISHDMKCQIKCAMEKTGQLNNGHLDVAASLKFFDSVPELKQMHDIVEKDFEACKNESGTDDCETAFKIHACIFKLHDKKN